MTEGDLLSLRESAARALSVFTLADAGLSDEALLQQILGIAGPSVSDLLQVMAAMSSLGLAMMDMLSPDDPLVVIRRLGSALDSLDD